MKNLTWKLCLIFVCFITCSCMRSQMSEVGKTVNHLISEVEQMLTKKYRMAAIGVALGMPGGVVKTLGIHFQIVGPLPKEKLRSILVYAAQDFVDYVNANKNIKPFLENDPFEIKNIDIVLFFIDTVGYEIEHPNIGIAGIRKGKIDYSTLETINGIPKYVTKEWETYEEAVKILQEQAAIKTNSSE